MKAAIVERVIRTVKNWIYREFSARGEYKWYDILPHLTNSYNDKKHRTIGMKPSEVTPTTILKAYSHPKIAPKPKYKVGDVVRISKFKGVFEKGYSANFSTELFTITKVNITNPTTYNLDDIEGNPMKGSLYEMELLKTKNPKVYLVEKVLKKDKSGKNVYVKWLGYPKEHNSWIKKSAIT